MIDNMSEAIDKLKQYCEGKLGIIAPYELINNCRRYLEKADLPEEIKKDARESMNLAYIVSIAQWLIRCDGPHDPMDKYFLRQAISFANANGIDYNENLPSIKHEVKKILESRKK